MVNVLKKKKEQKRKQHPKNAHTLHLASVSASTCRALSAGHTLSGPHLRRTLTAYFTGGAIVSVSPAGEWSKNA